MATTSTTAQQTDTSYLADYDDNDNSTDTEGGATTRTTSSASAKPGGARHCFGIKLEQEEVANPAPADRGSDDANGVVIKLEKEIYNVSWSDLPKESSCTNTRSSSISDKNSHVTPPPLSSCGSSREGSVVITDRRKAAQHPKDSRRHCASRSRIVKQKQPSSTNTHVDTCDRNSLDFAPPSAREVIGGAIIPELSELPDSSHCVKNSSNSVSTRKRRKSPNTSAKKRKSSNTGGRKTKSAPPGTEKLSEIGCSAASNSKKIKQEAFDSDFLIHLKQEEADDNETASDADTDTKNKQQPGKKKEASTCGDTDSDIVGDAVMRVKQEGVADTDDDNDTDNRQHQGEEASIGGDTDIASGSVAVYPVGLFRNDSGITAWGAGGDGDLPQGELVDCWKQSDDEEDGGGQDLTGVVPTPLASKELAGSGRVRRRKRATVHRTPSVVPVQRRKRRKKQQADDNDESTGDVVKKEPSAGSMEDRDGDRDGADDATSVGETAETNVVVHPVTGDVIPEHLQDVFRPAKRGRRRSTNPKRKETTNDQEGRLKRNPSAREQRSTVPLEKKTERAERNKGDKQGGKMSQQKKKTISRDVCRALGCLNARYKPQCKGMHFFKFPRCEERRRQWIQNSRLDDLRGKSAEFLSWKGYKFCDAHFEMWQFNRPAERDRLVWNAVPTIFDGPNAPPRLMPRSNAGSSLSSSEKREEKLYLII